MLKKPIRKGISVFTVCKNRNHHLAQMLASIVDFAQIDEIVIVDWSSNESLEPVIGQYNSDKIILAEVPDQDRFLRCHALNLAARLTTRDTLLKLDADVQMTSDFFSDYSVFENSYATFWNANVLTELSDGQVEVGNLQEDNFASPFLWLTHKKYYREGYHEGKCFLLTTVGELAAAENGNEGNLSIIRQGTEVYNDGQYIIYDYPDTHLFPKIDSAG